MPQFVTKMVHACGLAYKKWFYAKNASIIVVSSLPSASPASKDRGLNVGNPLVSVDGHSSLVCVCAFVDSCVCLCVCVQVCVCVFVRVREGVRVCVWVYLRMCVRSRHPGTSSTKLC